MSDSIQPASIRRILVALDASIHSLTALEAVATLAARLDAELLGLFVEDVNLMRLAGLPFAREMGPTSSAPRRLLGVDMERALRAQAIRAQQALAASAERMRVRWSFRVARGQVVAQVLGAAGEVDLVAIGMTGQAPGRRTRVGSTARGVISGATCPVLVLRAGAGVRLPVVVIYDGTPDAARALDVACQLVAKREDGLIVLIPSAEQATAERLEREAAAQLNAADRSARYRRIATDVAALLRAVCVAAAGTLVLARNTPLLDNAALEQLLSESNCAILSVR